MWPAHKREGREAIATLYYGIPVAPSSGGKMQIEQQVWFRIKFLSSFVEYMTSSDKQAFLDICEAVQEGSLAETQVNELERLFKAFDERRI